VSTTDSKMQKRTNVLK